MLVDSHAHLNSIKYENDLSTVIENAKKNNVGIIIVNGYDLESSKKAVEIARSHLGVYATVGIHPLDIEGFELSWLDELRVLASDENVVAIGEIGLDYYYDKSTAEQQKEIFMLQLQLAEELDLPVTIHSRDGIDDTYQILKSTNNYGVMHCYSSRCSSRK